MIPETIHVFATDNCNLDCAYCFKEHIQEDNPENLLKIAEILARNNVKHVVIGGGEPTLVKNLDDILTILKEKDIFVEMHTNCTALTRERLEQLTGKVDMLGIPIDTLNKDVQGQLRGYPDYVKLIKQVAKDAQDLDFKIVYHTVATYLNVDSIPALYRKFIGKTDFDLWKVYEFNENLASQSNFSRMANMDVLVDRHLQIKEMQGPINHEKGLSDGLLAKFLLTEEKMKQYDDKRILFVGNLDVSPYLFINSLGDVEFYTWFSKDRMKFSNIFKQRFSTVLKKFNKLSKKGYKGSSTDFFDALNDQPIFARLYEGNYDAEEFNEIDKKYWPKVEKLANLWEIRRYGEAKTRLYT